VETWRDVQTFINRYSLPYTVIRFNLSREGLLILTATGETVADTVKDAEEHLRTKRA
jgi:hypothetical protein